MQLTIVVEVDPSPVYDFHTVANTVEDGINAIYGPHVHRVVVEKIFRTRRNALVRIDPDTADRVYT